MNKVYASCQEAIADVFEGATIMFGGWGPTGDPENLIRELVAKGTKNITALASDPGNDRDGILYGLHPLIKEKRVRKFIGSYHAWNQEFIKQFKAGELEFEVCSQGIFVERIVMGAPGCSDFIPMWVRKHSWRKKRKKGSLTVRPVFLRRPLRRILPLSRPL
jgi:3-oxoacid CoA-transferase subunit A